MNYNITVFLDDSSIITIPAEYENEYTLKQNVTAIGNNGVWESTGSDYIFTPSHRIFKIDVWKDKK